MPRTGRPKGIANPPRDVTCVVCGAGFQTTHSQGRYCSAECRRKGHRKTWQAFSAARDLPDQRRIAYNAVNAALKAGRMKMQPCERCGKSPADAHHPDYSKPLEVIWLCKSHHREEHGRNKPKEN